MLGNRCKAETRRSLRSLWRCHLARCSSWDVPRGSDAEGGKVLLRWKRLLRVEEGTSAEVGQGCRVGAPRQKSISPDGNMGLRRRRGERDLTRSSEPAGGTTAVFGREAGGMTQVARDI